jgi:Transposase DDE domain
VATVRVYDAVNHGRISIARLRRSLTGLPLPRAVDTTGLVLDVVITAASIQDRDAARPLLWNLRRACTRVRLVWADGGYQAGRLAS